MQKCFIITPTEISSDYSEGHVDRVHNYILAPACQQAGYSSIRAGEETYADVLGILKEIVDYDMVLCDLSANNQDALYVLAVRRALGLPVILVKDKKTILPFNISELGILEYDESLRIDTVQKEVQELGEAVRNAGDAGLIKHELLVQLGIPKTNDASESMTFGEESEAEMREQEREARHVLPIISPLPDYVDEPFTEEELDELKEGDELFHLNHGRGKVIVVAKKSGNLRVAKVDFDSGARMIILGASNLLRKISS